MQRRFIAILAVGICLRFSSAGLSQTDVWMLAPGFTVRELPVKLSNINNLRFAPDGRLTALGYDGRVHLLKDTDGDGLEDRDVLFWDKTTISVPVGMVWSKLGLYVSSHGKVSLLRDMDGDGRADVEEIIASGWQPTDVGSGGVDATAVTLDKDGNLYFGLLTADYSNPYRVRDGVSHYDVKGRRGTIQKWSAVTHELETIATGIRVPYTLAFNRHGDLFVTDQEGETWCPDGNPLDELNWIVPGRNYGFPPRHVKYLPNLISEPPVVAFDPQHQSACGLVFNESRPGQKAFGPPAWDGDAFVTGESRGKIWRVRLVKTPVGYLGGKTLLARLNMLTTDAIISPGGDLYVCCHSGPPDWGTGPKGQGKLFKISYTDPDAPQWVAVWASDPMQVNVAFDRPIDGAITNRWRDMQIEFGAYVSAADRLEVLKPPYEVVKRQEATPVGKLRVVSARLSQDARTLELITDPHPQNVSYALMLPGVRADGSQGTEATVDLAYGMHGVEARWFGVGQAAPDWTGWLPHLDWEADTEFTAGSAAHGRWRELARKKGRWQFRTRLALPGDEGQLRIEAGAPFELRIGERNVKSRTVPSGRHATEVAVPSTAELLTLSADAGGAESLDLHATYRTAMDSTWRPVPFASWMLPWAPPAAAPPLVALAGKELTDGDYERGRALFFGERLKCSTCHRLRGEGASVGPDLSNLAHRDAASVLRDIQEPSAMINPDYVAYHVRLHDGDEWTGFVRAQTEDLLRVVGADAQERSVRRAEVAELRPSEVSLMPLGLLEGLNQTQIDDLLVFLVNAPPVRSQADVEALRKHPAGSDGISAKPLNIVLVASKQDHGPGQHDYPAWQKKWSAMLAQAPQIAVSEAWQWPSPAQWRTADVMVFYFWNHNWSGERYEQMDAFQKRGGGIVLFHAAVIADQEPEELAKRIGLASQPGASKYRHTPLVLKFVAPTNHVIARGFTNLKLLDEPYWPLFGDTNRIDLLATAEMEGQPRPLIWTYERGRGRVFASIPGHYTWTFDDPMFRIMALRGIAWAAHQSPDRFSELE